MKITLQQKFLLVVLLLVTSLGAAGFVNSLPTVTQGEQVITYALPYDFSEYSQFTADSYATAQWTGAVYAGLYARDSDNDRDYSPNLADGPPSVSSDGLTWKINLKPDLKFATGNPLTAEDVVFSYKVALTPGINTNGYGLLSQYFASNDSIVQVDADTVEFTLSGTYAFAMGLFTQGIIEKAEFQADYNACLDGDTDACTWNRADGSDARSAGPYMVESIDTTNMVVTLVKNEHYWDADSVLTEKIIYKKIATGEAAISELSGGTIDILDSQYVPAVDAFQGLSGITNTFVGDPAHQEISLNHFNEYFGTGAAIPGNDGTADADDALLVRKAMSHIVNRENFVSQILQGLGQPAATTMPSASLGWDSSLEARDYNLTHARGLMEQAGFDYTNLGDEGEDRTFESNFFNITVLSPDTNPARNQWSTLYTNELPKLGIGVKQHVSTGWADIIPRTFGSEDQPQSYAEGGFDILFVGYSWGLDYDPSGLYTESGFCGTGDCSNFMNYDNDTVETLIGEYTSELTFEDRLTKVETLQQALHDDIPVIAILYPQSHWGWADDMTGIDELLISSSLQEWGEVAKSGWTTAPAGQTLDARAPLSGGSDGTDDTGDTTGGGIPFNSAYAAASLVSLSLIAIYRRRKLN